MVQPAHSAREKYDAGYLGLLRLPQMPTMAMAHLISTLGTVAAEVALSLLVYQETRSALYAALTISAAFAPQALSGTLLSALAERYTSRFVLVGANILSAALAGLMIVPGAPVWLDLLLAAVLGSIVPLYNGVRATAMAESLAPAAYAGARSLIRVISQSSLVFGFLYGGLLASAVGPRAVIGGNAASFVMAAILLWRTPAQAAANCGRAVLGASLSGLRYILGDQRIRLIVLSFWLPPSFASVGSGLVVAYAAQSGHGGTSAGVLFAAFAVGTVGAEVTGTHLRMAARQRAVPYLMLLTQLPALGFIFAPSIAVAAVLRMLSGSGFGYLQGLDLELVRSLDSRMRRRAMVTLSSGVMACQGVAILAGGALGSAFPPALVIALSGAAGTIVAVALLVRRLQLNHATYRKGSREC